MAKLHTEVRLEGARDLTLIIGLSSRNLFGFIFLWTHIFFFIWKTKRAPGCSQALPGIAGPFEVLLISYWDSEESLKAFVRSKAHIRWMQFIYKHPRSMNLFNETYSAPLRANFINEARGYAKCVETAEQRRPQ